MACLRAQDASAQPAPDPPKKAPASVSEKWKFFLAETFTPLTPVAGAMDATVSQLTHSAPLYGRHFWRNHAYLKRFGASLADTASENFFADFVLASALHEDTRYVRRGPSHRLWPRIGYAISRAVVTRTDSGEATFNWANVSGAAMSAALSNAYYPPISRTPSAATVNWATNLAGSGMVNLLPEFGPDVHQWLKRHLSFHHEAGAAAPRGDSKNCFNRASAAFSVSCLAA
jgi:hypothetical protein